LDNDGVDVNATNNWWGHSSGPYHPAANENGSGDNVTDHVRFSPWLTRFKGYTSPLAFVEAISPSPAPEGRSVYFKGFGLTPEDNITHYRWRSSIDGELYNGTTSSFLSQPLTPGEHTIFFKVENATGWWSEETSITLLVHKRPQAVINSISPDYAFETGNILFNGTGTDDGWIVRYVWSSSINGEFYNDTEATFFMFGFSLGIHIISFKVQDNLGAWSKEASATLTIHKPPTAIIHSISPNPAYHYENVRFQGNGTDDGEIIRYSWRSSIDKDLYNGTNASFTISNLSRGTHTIYLKIRDDHGIWSEEVAAKLAIRPKARKQASNIGLYMRDTDDCPTLNIRAGEDDVVTFDLRLENYNASDFVERVVLLYVVPRVNHGDEDNWEFAFLDAENHGLPYFTGDHPVFGTTDFYKYVVKGDGTPTNVTFWFWHDYEILIDNEDDIEFLIHGLDYEAEDEPEQEEELERFLFKIIENGSCQNHNVTYLMEEGKIPNVDATNLKRLRSFICGCPGFLPWVRPDNTFIEMVADEVHHDLSVTLENEGWEDDELSLEAEVEDDTAEWWDVSAKLPYMLGNFIPLDGSPCGVNRNFTVTLLISLKNPANYTKVPHGSYKLRLTAESNRGGFTDEKIVIINLLQRYDPQIYLDPTDTDDKLAHTNGTPTSFRFKLKNNGTLTDTISLDAEAGDMANRAGDTNEYWTREFYPASPVTLGPGETVDVYLNITPTLDNTKIFPGKYPVFVNVTSDNNPARKDVAEVYVRMPSLYAPPDDPVAPPFQIGSEEVLKFTVMNLGRVEDTLALGLELRDPAGALVASLDEPGSWLFSFKNADTGAPLTESSVTLASWAEQDVHLRITPMAGTPSGDYTLHISITPGELGQDMRMLDVPLTVLPLDLWITSDDIEIIPPEVDEGEVVVIKVTVHLDGAIEPPISVEFFYKTTSSGFVYLGGVELDFGGKVNTEETVTFTWDKANVPRATGQNIRVWVDAADLVKEENETNNAASATITVREKSDNNESSDGLISAFIVFLAVAAASAYFFMRRPQLLSFLRGSNGCEVTDGKDGSLDEKRKEQKDSKGPGKGAGLGASLLSLLSDQEKREDKTQEEPGSICPDCGKSKESEWANCEYCSSETESSFLEEDGALDKSEKKED